HYRHRSLCEHGLSSADKSRPRLLRIYTSLYNSTNDVTRLDHYLIVSRKRAVPNWKAVSRCPYSWHLKPVGWSLRLGVDCRPLELVSLVHRPSLTTVRFLLEAVDF